MWPGLCLDGFAQKVDETYLAMLTHTIWEEIHIYTYTILYIIIILFILFCILYVLYVILMTRMIWVVDTFLQGVSLHVNQKKTHCRGFQKQARRIRGIPGAHAQYDGSPFSTAINWEFNKNIFQKHFQKPRYLYNIYIYWVYIYNTFKYIIHTIFLRASRHLKMIPLPHPSLSGFWRRFGLHLQGRLRSCRDQHLETIAAWHVVSLFLVGLFILFGNVWGK